MRRFTILLAFLLASGCSDASVAAHGPTSGAGDVKAGDASLTQADGAALDATATADAGTDATAPDDAAGSDDVAGPDDSAGVVDASVQDVVAGTDAAVDTVGPDVAPQDTGPVDTVSKDTGAGICIDQESKFNQLRTKALACSTPFQCWHPGPKQELCPCKQFYSDATLDWKGLLDLEVEAGKAGCQGDCTKTPEACAPANTQVGVCQAGGCVTISPTCKHLDQFASAAIGEGIKCTSDSQCTFKVSSTLGCGCPAYVNVQTMGPAKPLFEYMKMLVLVYKNLACTADIECACPNPNSAHCVAGVCKGDL